MYEVKLIRDGKTKIVDAFLIDKCGAEINEIRNCFFCPDCNVQMTFFTRSNSGTSAHFKTRVNQRHHIDCSKVTIQFIDKATEENKYIINEVQKVIQDTDFFTVNLSPTESEDQTIQYEDKVPSDAKTVVHSNKQRDHHSIEPAKRRKVSISLKRILLLLVYDELKKLQKKVKVKAEKGDYFLEFNVENYFIRLEQATPQHYSRCYWGKIDTISAGHQYINTEETCSNQVIIVIHEAIREKLAKRYGLKEQKALKNTYVIIKSKCEGNVHGKRWIKVNSLADISIQKISPK